MGKIGTVASSMQQQLGREWLMGESSAQFWSQFEQFQSQFEAERAHRILLAEADPVRFLAAFLAACSRPCRVWLGNPRWGQREWEQVAAQCQPDLLITSSETWKLDSLAFRSPSLETSPPTATQILIPTGGSSGDIRFAVHTWETLSASVQGFQQHFQSDTINAYCVLPLFHVSGLMQAMRCLLSGGQLLIQPFRELIQEGEIAALPLPCFLSLVPTQLQRLLNSDRDFTPWLRQFTAILLGGAPAWPTLLQMARTLKLPLAPTYGMTETASQVATLLPSEFLAGQTGSGRPLPHARIEIANPTGQPLPPSTTGQILIEADSLASGYWQMPFAQPFSTGDLGYLDERGILHVLGRESRLIMTGGEKVLPEEVEKAIIRTGLVGDVAVVGIPDQEWGEIVVAVVVPDMGGWDSDLIVDALKPQLSPHKIPKHFFPWTSLPYTTPGKVNRIEIEERVKALLAQKNAAS